MHITPLQVIEIVSRAADLIRRWGEQEQRRDGPKGAIADSDVTEAVQSLKIARLIAAPSQISEIDRVVDAAEVLLKSPDRRQGTPLTSS